MTERCSELCTYERYGSIDGSSGVRTPARSFPTVNAPQAPTCPAMRWRIRAMMMTDAAIVTLDESWHSVLRRVSSWFRPSNSAQRSMESIGIASNDASAMAPFVEDAINHAHNDAAADTADQARKQARVAAVRGLLYARDARLDRAEHFFTEAMSLDTTLSPADIPT